MSLFPECPIHWIETPSPPDPPQLISGILPTYGHMLITGETEVGKTLIALEIAHSALTGSPLWGVFKPTSIVSKVTYFMGEHDREVVKSLWRKTTLTVPPETLNLIGPEHRRWLVSHGTPNPGAIGTYKKWAEGSGLVIFDPLGAFATGWEVENDAGSMRHLVNSMKDIAAGPIVILAHMGKPTWVQQAQTHQQRPSYASRGSSAIEDAVTCCFYMEKRSAGIYALVKRKFKGDAPNQHMLTRDPVTLCHSVMHLTTCPPKEGEN